MALGRAGTGPRGVQIINQTGATLAYLSVVQLRPVVSPEAVRIGGGIADVYTALTPAPSGTGRGNSMGLFGVVTSRAGIVANAMGDAAIGGGPVRALINCRGAAIGGSNAATRVSQWDELIVVSGQVRFRKWRRGRLRNSATQTWTLNTASNVTISALTGVTITATGSVTLSASTILISPSVSVSVGGLSGLTLSDLVSANTTAHISNVLQNYKHAIGHLRVRQNQIRETLVRFRTEYNSLHGDVSNVRDLADSLRNGLSNVNTQRRNLTRNVRALRTQVNGVYDSVSNAARSYHQIRSTVARMFDVQDKVRAIYVGSAVLTASNASGDVILLNARL